MTLNDIPRANALAEELKRLKTAHDLLARYVPVTLSIPTGSFDGVTGRNHTSEFTLAGVAVSDLRKVIKQDYGRVAANLATMGIVVRELDYVPEQESK